MRAIWSNQDTFGLLAKIQPLYHFAYSSINDDKSIVSQIRNQNQLSIERELQPVRAVHLHIESLRYPFCRDVNDGNRAIARIRCPILAAVRRNVASFRPFPTETIVGFQ